ncbi:MAG: lytic murein transglycosylase [Alsobacter sp.]
MNRRSVLAGLAAASALARPGAARATGSTAPNFAAFLPSLWPRAQAQGVGRGVFEAAIAGLAADPGLLGPGPRQSEFLRPMKAYVAEAASAGRVGRGRAAMARHAAVLGPVEARSGVPASMVVALWGLESDYGAAMGRKDVVRSLATLAYARGEDAPFADEFAFALLMLQRGDVSREGLVGSWAGAMGHPQFMPSAYLRYAVPASGQGHADIWTSVPDSLASIASFLQQSGWQRGEPWGMQVVVPAGYDHAALRLPMRRFAQLGFRGLDGATPAGGGEGMLFYPVGAGGPAFLLGPNFFVLKAYNFSDNYAMAGSVLADRIAGREPVSGSWPDEAKPLDAAERRRIQSRLKEAGVYQGTVDGRFGPVTRDAVHAWQRQAGVAPADGHPSRAVLDRLDREAKATR